jgi:protein-tyrosine phosphatase
MDLLLVCTGNICRSPMGEALLRARLAARGVDAHVHSAGTMAWYGAPTDHAATVMREHGLDITAHASRPLAADLVASADLVLGMTREHVWAVASHVPDAAGRTFLVGEAVRLGERVGPRTADEPVRVWAARLDAARPAAPVIGQAGDEVADPVGEPIEVYRSAAERLDRDLGALASLLAP